MQIQVNTDHNIEGTEALAAHVADVVHDDLSLLADHVTRVEVHLSDQGSSHDDKRCMMEARLEGRQPIAVSRQSASIDQAIAGASKKLERVVAAAVRVGSDPR